MTNEEMKDRLLPSLFTYAMLTNGEQRDYYVDKAKEVMEYLKEHEAFDAEQEWITVNGTHIPVDENGDLKGKVGEKIEAESKESTPATVSTKPSRSSISQTMQPKNDYEMNLEEDDEDSFTNKNLEKLEEIYENEGIEACTSEFWKTRMAMSTGEPSELGKDKTSEILYDNVPQNVYDGWFREANSGYKPRLVWNITKNPEVRNACLNRMYENYKYFNEGDGTSFEEFLTTPVKMYRGGYGQKHVESDVFSAYSFDRKIAEYFVKKNGGNGKVTEAMIRPIDTYGSLAPNGEAEILVPREIAPNGETDSREDGDDTNQGTGTIVYKNGLFLVGTRSDNGETASPGGHIQDDETPEQGAIREVQEEFRITPTKLTPIGVNGTSHVYLCTEYEGVPQADGVEMKDERWISIEQIQKEKLFAPFKMALVMMFNELATK